MARGDLTVFEEAKATIIKGGWEPADEIWIGIVTNVCLVDDPEPGYGAFGTTQYTPIATAGTYAAGGLLLDTLGDLVTEAAGVMKFDTNGGSDNEFPTWVLNGANPQNGDHAVIYHKTSGLCIAMIDLDGPIDMQASTLMITFHGSGIFTIT